MQNSSEKSHGTEDRNDNGSAAVPHKRSLISDDGNNLKKLVSTGLSDRIEPTPLDAESLTKSVDMVTVSVTEGSLARRTIKEELQVLMSEELADYESWASVFSKIEHSELVNHVRLDELNKEAKQLELSLLNQKEQLKHKLGILANLLLDENHD